MDHDLLHLEEDGKSQCDGHNHRDNDQNLHQHLVQIHRHRLGIGHFRALLSFGFLRLALLGTLCGFAALLGTLHRLRIHDALLFLFRLENLLLHRQLMGCVCTLLHHVVGFLRRTLNRLLRCALATGTLRLR